MKKIVAKVFAVILLILGLKIVVVEPDKPHTFEVTIPSFNSVVDFFYKVGEATEEVAQNFKEAEL
jgi:hypothetical protein